jgi:16S rRNA (guanine966-N2)-methyltransferase
VRIIGGRWRGRRLAIPHGTVVRPTPDRVRETVFNWLADSIVARSCLDLFAGTGVLGLEALSRGAGETLFIERDAALAAALRARISELQANARVLQHDVSASLRKPPPRRFDLVFLDPPYEQALEPVLAALDPWLADGARVYVERPQADGNPEDLERIAAVLAGGKLVKRSRAGGVVFALLECRRP